MNDKFIVNIVQSHAVINGEGVKLQLHTSDSLISKPQYIRVARELLHMNHKKVVKLTESKRVTNCCFLRIRDILRKNIKENVHSAHKRLKGHDLIK